jgi:translation elongation factor EF-1beta
VYYNEPTNNERRAAVNNYKYEVSWSQTVTTLNQGTVYLDSEKIDAFGIEEAIKWAILQNQVGGINEVDEVVNNVSGVYWNLIRVEEE